MDYFVYILYFPESDTSYVGQTDNLILRYYRHRDKQSQWTSRHNNPIMIYWESCDSRSDAIKREKYFKSGRGALKKKRIINNYKSHWL